MNCLLFYPAGGPVSGVRVSFRQFSGKERAGLSGIDGARGRDVSAEIGPQKKPVRDFSLTGFQTDFLLVGMKGFEPSTP